MTLTRRDADKPYHEYLNKRPYDLVHKIKESWVEEEFDEEGYTLRSFYFSKTICGLKLIHDKWDNTFVGIESYNCKRCKRKEYMNL